MRDTQTDAERGAVARRPAKAAARAALASVESGAGRSERILALQRLVGNRAVAALLGRKGGGARAASAGGPPPLQLKGRIRSTVDDVDSSWKAFDLSSKKVEETIYGPYFFLLAQHSKAAGVTKKPVPVTGPPATAGTPASTAGTPTTGSTSPPASKRRKVDDGPSAPPVKSFPIPGSPRGLFPSRVLAAAPGGLRSDPVAKERAVAVGKGLKAWATSAIDGAERYYAEMRSALHSFKGPSLEWRFGTDVTTEADIVTMKPPKPGQADEAGKLEVKRSGSADYTMVNDLLRAARYQLAAMRHTGTFSGADAASKFVHRTLHVEVTNPGNPWPLTDHEAGPWGLPVTERVSHADILKSLKKRPLGPKKDSATADAPGQVHHVVVRWEWAGTVKHMSFDLNGNVVSNPAFSWADPAPQAAQAPSRKRGRGS